MRLAARAAQGGGLLAPSAPSRAARRARGRLPERGAALTLEGGAERAQPGRGAGEQADAGRGKLRREALGRALDLDDGGVRLGKGEPGANHTSSKNGPPTSSTASAPSSAFRMAAASKGSGPR